MDGCSARPPTTRVGPSNAPRGPLAHLPRGRWAFAWPPVPEAAPPAGRGQPGPAVDRKGGIRGGADPWPSSVSGRCREGGGAVRAPMPADSTRARRRGPWFLYRHRGWDVRFPRLPPRWAPGTMVSRCPFATQVVPHRRGTAWSKGVSGPGKPVAFGPGRPAPLTSPCWWPPAWFWAGGPKKAPTAVH